ncbi:MAG TPA: hypothetical protein VLA48_02755 [Nitrososphaeraceae archaeon]|nr:hypothetical protein [Nitrososphaeraceae archaeon]
MDLKQRLQGNVVDYIKDWTDEELCNLTRFFGAEIETRKPSDKEILFIKEFIGEADYAEFVMLTKSTVKHSFSNIKILNSNINEIYSYLSFQSNQRLAKLILTQKKSDIKLNKQKLKILELKKDLLVAVENSYDGGVFYKVDGWCNVLEVLENHKLIKLTKD